MIYTKLINRFWELDESWQFTGTETRLYFYLLKVAHSSHWECKRSDAKISSDVGVSVKIFKSARGRLVEADLIEYLQGNGRGNKSGYIIKGVPKGMQNLPTFSQKGIPKGRQILPTFSEDKGVQNLPTFIEDSDCISSDCEKENFDKGMQNLPTFSQKTVETKENKENTPTPLKENKENTTHFNKEKEKIYKKEKDIPQGGMAELFPNTDETPPRRVKPKIEPPPYDDVLQYFRERIPDQEEASNMAYCFYEHFRSLGWRTSRGAKIEYWDSKANLWIIDSYDRRRNETIRTAPKTQGGACQENPQHSQDRGTDTGASKDYNQTF